ncbi:type II toxin-antitoxin system VapC family toxin [Enhydrobacter sp.]|uniref:type II toxin-antitoxin system VapC family toxin n=1 Tax=Enhydrobacter sp. TaxID=1894999 RepID=UPI00262F8C2C|nr:type II toxin-antitoxin system VapC family toxin [Enhydrobacter sp.]WIM12071.1 MAG: Death on curing protein, Doc toxin [Enhydrobacter sp.]
MRLLLDTHAFLWWLAGERALTRKARTAIESEDNNIFVSAVTAWEIAMKFRIGKLPDAAAIARDVTGAIAAEGFSELALSMAHAEHAGALDGPHRDPFDRMLIAQSLIDGLALISNERAFDRYGVTSRGCGRKAGGHIITRLAELEALYGRPNEALP